jgi:hypothetical protein
MDRANECATVTEFLDNQEPTSTGSRGQSPFAAAVRLGGAVGIAVLRPAAGAVSAALRLEREARRALGRRLGDTTLSALDAAMASRIAEEAVDRAITSGLAERAIGRALEGPFVDALAKDLARHAVIERIADHLLAEGTVEHTLDRVFAERRLIDEAVDRLIESEDLWRLVEEIAQSPAVTEAITRQSVGFADQVAGGVRRRSRNADARLERAARRALRRPPRRGSQAGP